MCKTQILGICLQRTVRQRTKGKKRHNIIVCPPPSHPAERMGHFYSIHTAGVAKLHFRLRLQLSDFLRATTMSLPPFYSPILFKRMDRRASGASVVAIDNKIEQAMDLVKNHLMYAVREEVEILKEQIKELAEKNNQLERENSLLKNLASPEQLEKFQSRLPSDSSLPLEPLELGSPEGSAV
uniref:TSC22 domain family protein 3 n=1 Tax=Cyprinus carpio TaxID=7962 RepID=A0A8C2JW62_CYPCA